MKKDRQDDHRYGELYNIINRRLIDAIESNDFKKVKELVLDKKMSVAGSNNKAVKTAAKLGFLDILKFLEENGANSRSGDNYALRVAAVFGHIDIVKHLHKNGGNLSSQKHEALINAIKGEHFELVKYIHKNTRDDRINVSSNIDAIKTAVARNNDQIIDYLLEKGYPLSGLSGDDRRIYRKRLNFSIEKKNLTNKIEKIKSHKPKKIKRFPKI